MKKLICILLTVLLCAAPVFAAELDQHAILDGMGRSWYQGYEPAIKSHKLTIHLPLEADDLSGDITASIALDDPNVALLASEPKAVTVSAKNGIYPVKLTLSLLKNRRNGDYPATITIQNGEKTEILPYIIRIRDGDSSHETLEPVISDVSGELNVGSEGQLTLTITNPTTTLSMTDAVITVTDPSGEVLMSGSNRFEIPEIPPGKRQTIAIPMTVLANAAIKTHILDLDLRYRVLGINDDWKESFTVPVTQAIRLENGAISAPSAIAGELADFTLPLMNLGNGELSNVLVKLELDGVLNPQSVLVGTLSPGETKQAKLTFTPSTDAVGTHPGTVTITCEDAYGNTDIQTLEVTLTVDEPLPDVPEIEEEERKKIHPGTVVLAAVCILLTIGLVVQGTLLTNKLHKLEEERL